MEEKFVWDEVYEGLSVAGPSKAEEDKKRVKKRKSEVVQTKVYCPHKRLIFNFKESLSFNEQSKFRKQFSRRGGPSVVLLQDVKDLALYTVSSPLSRELIGLWHTGQVDRFLRALLLYLQSFTVTWTQLGERRAAAAKRAPNPLAGGARLERAHELAAMRQLLAREYGDLLCGWQPELLRDYHHLPSAGASSDDEKDLRMHEGMIQLSHAVAWIGLFRRHKLLLEIEIHRLFRTDAFNMARRKFKESVKDFEVPKDEHWILYGPEMPRQKKILSNSPLPFEVLNTRCDYRILSIGLRDTDSEDPRIAYLENALLANEEDLPKLGIKLGILGLPRADFDILLIPQSSEDEQTKDELNSSHEDEEADDYETLLPPSAFDVKLNEKFSVNKMNVKFPGDNKSRKSSKKIWMSREQMRAASNYMETFSISMKE
ncbi:hypothetical protein QAD02_001393 [Eretmocerus hayati]|uniref:Uncharacterized protein n=1 Tax=Eretmocerus hayati TaxID=131215 RepID=A0ACC2NFW6_9HYME|nr:hypothetical protein QAD02_001393 [Eretmocerus hayati]